MTEPCSYRCEDCKNYSAPVHKVPGVSGGFCIPLSMNYGGEVRGARIEIDCNCDGEETGSYDTQESRFYVDPDFYCAAFEPKSL